MKKIAVACVGCGDLALRGVLPHLALRDAHDKVELVAVCDVDEERARTTSQRFNVGNWQTDYNQLLRDPSVEMVLLLTPTPLHAEQAIAAMRSGKHVYLQKPIGGSLEEAQGVVSESEKNGVRLLVAPAQRLCPLIGEMRKRIVNGEIGTVYWALTATHWPTTYEGSDFDRSWHYRKGGGPLCDRTIYSLATLTDLVGPARRVTALSGLRETHRHSKDRNVRVEVHDNTLLLLEHAQGVYAVATGNYCKDGKVVPAGFIGIYGSQGSMETVEVDPGTWYPTKVEVRCDSGKEGWVQHTVQCSLDEVPGLTGGHALLPEAHVYADIMHLVDCVLEDKEPICHIGQAQHLVEVIEKAYLAAETGQTQTVTTRFD
ncbi:MAG: Gfo/Idh/MocA family oxidoreductase [Acidobacteriota bacterium]